MTIYSALCRGGVLALLLGVQLISITACSQCCDTTNSEMQFGIVNTGVIPIAGATVKLFRAGTQFDDSAELLGSAETNPDGVFEIEYEQLEDADGILYLIADGGSVKSRDKNKPNSSIKLATLLGRSEIPNSVTINERTTVATAYTMAQFIDQDDISGPAPGVPNAADIFRNLVNLENGDIGQVLSTSPNGNETDILQAFNSLANMLANCVNNQSTCETLFMLVTPEGLDEPADTFHATLNIVHYPYLRPALLHRYSSSEISYQPVLQNVPDAWTIALRYDGNGKEMDGPGFIAFDEDGSAWIANNYNWAPGTADPDGVVCGAKDVLRLTPTGEDAEGAPYTGGGANGAGFGLLIDRDGAVWQGNFGFAGTNCATPDKVLELSHSVSKYDKDGNAISLTTVPWGWPVTVGVVSGWPTRLR